MAMLSNLDLIRRVPLFSLLSNEQAKGIADNVVKRRYRRGEILEGRVDDVPRNADQRLDLGERLVFRFQTRPVAAVVDVESGGRQERATGDQHGEGSGAQGMGKGGLPHAEEDHGKRQEQRQCARLAGAHRAERCEGEREVGEAPALFPTETESERRSGEERGGEIVRDPTGLKRITVASRNQPHPRP